ncbi:hypothetical protein D9M69_449610 [compost metagenome]
MTEKTVVPQEEMATQAAETKSQKIARAVLTPENQSAAVLMGSKMFGDADINDVASELKRLTAAIHSGDMARVESMLVAQAHTLDLLFAKLASQALSADYPQDLETYLRLALKAQNQSRATWQTLAELKAPKQIAFVQQANIGNQVQVNNEAQKKPARTRKSRKPQNEL